MLLAHGYFPLDGIYHVSRLLFPLVMLATASHSSQAVPAAPQCGPGGGAITDKQDFPNRGRWHPSPAKTSLMAALVDTEAV